MQNKNIINLFIENEFLFYKTHTHIHMRKYLIES
jgi:hypothetical protein